MLIEIDWLAMEVVLGPKDSDADLPVKVMSAFREYHEQLEKKIIQLVYPIKVPPEPIYYCHHCGNPIEMRPT